MDWKFLFFSLDGRINRAKYWLGSLAVVVMGTAGILLILAMVGISDAAVAFTIALSLALLYPSYAVMAKRFQDRNKPGVLALFGIVPLVSSNLLQTFGYLDPENPSVILQIFDVVVVGISLWLLVELGILKGTQGPNRYGPDPLGVPQEDARL